MLGTLSSGVVRGASWNVLLRVADRSIGLLSTVILARLLAPADFGLIALATSLIALTALLSAFGFDIALIQNPNAERRHFDTVWTLNALFGLGTAVVVALLATPAAHFYSESRLVPVILGLAVARAISSFENVGLIALRKDMAFDREFKFLLYRRLATTFLATIPLAFIWRDYWALVGATIAGSVFGLALSYAIHPYRPRISLAAWRELFGFSRWLQLTNIVGFVSARAADFIIGRVGGVSAVGTFTISKEISNLASTELAMPIHRAVFPGYAKISDDLQRLKRAYLRVVSVLVLVTIPAGIGLALVANPVVLVFLGDKWRDVAPLIQVLAINGVLFVSLSTAAYVYLALGSPRRTTTLMAISAAVSVSMMLWLVPRFGVKGAAFAVLAGTLATMPVNYRFMSRAVGLTFGDTWNIVWRPVAATLVMAGAVTIAKQYWLSGETFQTNAVNLMATACVGAWVYGITVIVLWRLSGCPDSAEAFVLRRLKDASAAAVRRLRRE